MARVKRTHRVIADAKRQSDEALVRAGYRLEREAKELLSEGGGSSHQPSAPGDPPHLQSGDLRSSIKTAQTTDGTVVVGPTVKYGATHEFGLRNYPPRPFMRPAFRHIEPQLERVWI